MRRLLLACSLFALSGCGGAAPQAAGAPREARNRELDAQLAARDRGERAAPAGPRETVRIGGDEAEAPESAEVPGSAPEAPPRADSPRPVLSLEGSPEAASVDEATRRYGAPALPVAPLAPAPVYAPGPAPSPAPSSPAPPLVEGAAPPPLATAQRRQQIAAAADYRGALVALDGRRFAEAARALTRFVERYPEHPSVASALYWRGEAHYASRQYERALADFERVVREYPEGPKTPDALLKAGFCHLRMGDRPRADAYFSRLRREHPESVAARLANVEDSL